MSDETQQFPSEPGFPAFLTGKGVYLRSLEMTDQEAMWTWFADREVVRYSHGQWVFPFSRSDTQTWLEKTIRDKQTLTLGIVEQATQALIGFAGIAGISPINHNGEYFILIGSKACWSKGYGTEVTRLIVDYGFASLNLHRIMLTVSEINIGGVKAYERAGFIREGVMKEACYRDGQYHNKLMMAMLRSEWEARRAPSGG